MLNEIIEFARTVAREAGAIQLHGFRSGDTVISYKSRTDLVTNIDRESEKHICARINERFPEHSIIAEEGGGSDLGGDFLWYIDPLDATNNFAHGIPFFCVSLGIYSRAKGSVVAGVVFDPVHDELFTAKRGCGAYCNGERVKVSPTGDIGISLLATGFPYDKENSEKNNLKQFSAMLPKVQGIRRIGSAALDLCYVACGRLDGFWEPMLKPWDTAAGSLIVEEAGGRVSRYDGGRYDPEFPQIIASNGLIHESMTSLLNRC